MTDTSKLALPLLDAAQDQPEVKVNQAFQILNAAVQVSALTFADSPPGAPVEGDAHIVGTGTGDFATHDGDIAFYASGWNFLTPHPGWLAYVQSIGQTYRYEDGSPAGWQAFEPGGDAAANPVIIQVACSDLTTNITTGTSKAYCRAPRAMLITEVRASLLTGSSSGAVTVDINVNGSTILSTKLTIDQSETTSETAATPAVVSDDEIADDDILTFDIDEAGTGAKGLIVTVIGTPT